MSDLGRFIGTILGTSIIPFVFSFIGAWIGKKVGAWIAAAICAFMALYGNIKQGSFTYSEVFLVIICCVIQAFFCSWLVQRIRDIRNIKNQKNINITQEEMANGKIDNPINDATEQDNPVQSVATSIYDGEKRKLTKKKIIIALSVLIIVFLGVLICLYMFNYHFKRWIQVYCFNDSGYTRVLANDYAQKKEWKKATRLYLKAVDAAKASNDELDKISIPFIYNDFAKMLLSKKDYTGAICILEEALNYSKNDKPIYETMGKAYEGTKNYSSAFECYKKALYNSMQLTMKHKLLTKEEKKEVKEAKEKKNDGWGWWAHYDNAIIFKIALWYTYGQGCEKDLAKAANLWIYLANQDNYSAMYNLGLCYLRGEGVRQNFNTAFKLFKDAADNGEKKAMDLLSMCYEYGWGCDIDKSAANYWKELSKK